MTILGVPPYWRNETSGKLERAVLNFFEPYGKGEVPQPLSEEDLAYIRAYLTLYIESPVWKQNPYADSTEFIKIDNLIDRAKKVNSRDDIKNFIDGCLDIGLDPF